MARNDSGPVIMFEGYMHALRTTFGSSWKKRYFTLQRVMTSEIQLVEHFSKGNVKREKPYLSKQTVRGCRIVLYETEDCGKAHAFSITNLLSESMDIFSTTLEKLQVWVRALVEHGAILFPIGHPFHSHAVISPAYSYLRDNSVHEGPVMVRLGPKGEYFRKYVVLSAHSMNFFESKACFIAEHIISFQFTVTLAAVAKSEDEFTVQALGDPSQGQQHSPPKFWIKTSMSLS